MSDSSTRVPAFAPYLERDKDKELFEGEDSPRSRALDRTISESVERWIADDLDDALHLANTADKYLTMTDDEFAEFANPEGE